MNYSKLAEVYEELEKHSARLKKIDVISEFLKKADKNDLRKVVLLLQGKVFPAWDPREIGIASKSVVKIIAKTSGYAEGDIVKKFNKVGDFGKIAEELIGSKTQKTLFKKSLTIDKVFENLQKLASIEGQGSQDIKSNLVSELISSASGIEAKYIVKTILQELRIGVAEGVIRDSIGKAFGIPSKVVEDAWFLRSDYSEIIEAAKDGGEEALKKISIKLGIPIQPLLAEKSPGLKEALEEYENCALEFKYDGMRVFIHKDREKIWLFTRSLEDVTAAFPDIVELVKKNVKADRCILDSEAIGLDPKTGKPVPFQILSTRIKRKYDIHKSVEEIPVKVNLFDLLYLGKESLFEKPLKKRYELLKKSVKQEKGKFQLAEHLETKDLKEAEEFYRKSLEEGEEGLIVKNLDARYQPGRRVGYWVKVKPTMENLDLAIVGAVWGTGKRTGWLGSLILGCRDGDKFLQCGMMGTGIKEKKENPEDITFEELTQMLKPLIISEKGNEVSIMPKIVIEVAYEEIQKSPTYDSGYALRFPRFVRDRTAEKHANGCDTLGRIETLFKQQKKRN